MAPSTDPDFEAVNSVAPLMQPRAFCPTCQLSSAFHPEAPMSWTEVAVTLARKAAPGSSDDTSRLGSSRQSGARPPPLLGLVSRETTPAAAPKRFDWSVGEPVLL